MDGSTLCDFLGRNIFSNPALSARLGVPEARYKVESVTLGDLLSSHNAPAFIHFLSIDTEGSEYEVLKNFDFHSRQILFICVELSFNANLIERILVSNGYQRILSQYSGWDGWFVLNTYVPQLEGIT